MNIVPLLPLFMPSGLQSEPSGEPDATGEINQQPGQKHQASHTGSATRQSLKFLSMNLSIHNKPNDKAIEVIKTLDPDVLVLQELTPGWWNHLNSNLKSSYSHNFDGASTGYFGLGILSKLPLTKTSLQTLLPNAPCLLQTSVQLVNTAAAPSSSAATAGSVSPIASVNVIVIHTPTPKLIHIDEYIQYQRLLGTFIEERERLGPLVLIGDFNLTRFSVFYQDLFKKSRLANSEDGSGWQAGWPAELPSCMRVPIDHCWMSKDLRLIARKQAEEFGSDHLPLFVELGL